MFAAPSSSVDVLVSHDGAQPVLQLSRRSRPWWLLDELQVDVADQVLSVVKVARQLVGALDQLRSQSDRGVDLLE